MDNAFKRKRLKTRRNLDELRRKSRRQDENSTNKKNESSHKPNKLITSQRLTLASFRKAVQSKIVLRSEAGVKTRTTQSKKSLFGKIPILNKGKLRFLGDKSSSLEKQGEPTVNSPPLLSLEEKTDCENQDFASPNNIPRDSIQYDEILSSPSVTDVVKDSLQKSDADDETDEAQEILNYISEYIIPDVDDYDIFHKHTPYTNTNNLIESDESHHQLHSLSPVSDEIQANETPEHMFKKHLKDTVSMNGDSPDVFKKEMESIVDDTPEYTFFPHKLNQ